MSKRWFVFTGIVTAILTVGGFVSAWAYEQYLMTQIGYPTSVAPSSLSPEEPK